MKKLALLILIVIAVNADAQTQLRVRLADNSQIHVAVNGRHFDKQGTSITVGDLPPGKHAIKIYSTRYDRWGRSYERLVFQGPVRTHNGMITNFTYDPYTHQEHIHEQDPNDNTPYQPAPDNNQYRGHYAERKKNNDNDNNSAAGSNDDKYTAPAAPVASPIPSTEPGTLAEKKMEKLKTKVAEENTDTKKLKLLKDQLKKETASTLQVGYIMDWFLFESTKVEFSKWAYGITTDKENYSTLTNKFSYKSSQEELIEYLNGKQ